MRNFRKSRSPAITGRAIYPPRALPAILAVCLVLSACSARPRISVVANSPTAAVISHDFTRTTDTRAFDGLAYDEWSLNYKRAEKRPQTLLIFMNGSDLESDTGAGTADLKELMRSGVDEAVVNVVIFTGGANRWHTKAAPSNECAVSILRGGKIARIAELGMRDMGNAGTLASFIKFGLECFPAERTSLILWDHGGGSIAGYGADENFNMSTLTLLELEYAFEKAGLAQNRLELLGFDACLMATVEMAVVASRYAKYLLASENLEPGGGWDYRTVSVLSSGASGEEFGIAMCNSYTHFYRNPEEELTLSLIRTSKAEDVMGALGLLAEAAMKTFAGGDFRQLQLNRRNTKSFGSGTPLDESCDMIDILDFTKSFEKSCPHEAELVRGALNSAVRYSVYCSDTELGGLSVYHIYSERGDIRRSLEVYKSLGMSESYTEYLTAFAEKLAVGDRESVPVREPLYTHLFGGRTAMYEVSATSEVTFYAVSAKINGELAELIVCRMNGISEYEAAAGDADRLLGYRKRDGYLVQKGFDRLSREDEVVLLSPDGEERREVDTRLIA